MSSSPTVIPATGEVVTEFFQRFGAGDRAGTLALFAPDVDFLVQGAPFVPWSGARSTPEQIEAFLVSTQEEVKTEQFAVDATLVDGADAVVLGSFTHRVLRTDKAFSSRFALHVTVADGLIIRYHMFEDSYAIAQAFTA